MASADTVQRLRLASDNDRRNDRPQMIKMARSRDITAFVTQLANELGSVDACTTDIAAAALDNLRQRLRADQAVFWLSDGSTARRVIHAGSGSVEDLPALITFDDEGLGIL